LKGGNNERYCISGLKQCGLVLRVLKVEAVYYSATLVTIYQPTPSQPRKQ